jgi:peptidoglycan lytic transglycosylase G
VRRWLLGCLLVLVALVAAAGLAFWWTRSELRTPYYGAVTTEAFVDIPRGASSAAIATMLTDAGILRHRLPFILHLRLTGAGRRLQAGEYRFNSPASPIEIADKLIRGDVFFLSVTVPEGMTARESIAWIARNGLGDFGEMESALRRTDWIRELDSEARDLEGYLFPETYRFSRHATSEDILRAMVERFREVLGKLVAELPLTPGWSVSSIVTLASMVEKETNLETERSLVASVLTNRLEKGMPLACDPTVIYALKLAGKYNGNLRKGDLALDSPYNTYIHPGLPPGPIANPGVESLRAALAPPRTDYLFFVSRNDGSHEFSRDFESHSRAVAKYQKGMRH